MAFSLRTPRLLLREWRDDDRAPFARMSEDPAVMEMLLPMDRAASNAWITQMQAHYQKHGFCQWAVELPGEPVQAYCRCQISRFSNAHSSFSWFCRPAMCSSSVRSRTFAS